MSFAVSCLGCGGPTTQEVDPSRGVFAYCWGCRGEPGAIAWDDGAECATGTGADGRTYLVERVGGAWRWRGADYQSGAHRSMGAAKSHAEAYERKEQEDDMARKKKHEQTEMNGAASVETNGEVNGAAHAPTEPAPPPCVPAGSAQRKEYTEPLSVALTEGEVADLRKSLTDVTCERIGKETEIATLREAVKGLKDREGELAEKLQDGTHVKPVKCVEWLTPLNEIVVVRTDTGAEVERRTATADELQEQMPFEDPAEEMADVPADLGEVPGEIDDPEATLGEGGA